MGTCRAPCDPGGSGAGCTTGFTCTADSAVGTLMIGVCLPD